MTHLPLAHLSPRQLREKRAYCLEQSERDDLSTTEKLLHEVLANQIDIVLYVQDIKNAQ